MNAKSLPAALLATVATFAAFATVALAGPALAQACTPDQANDAPWHSRSTTTYQVANGAHIDDTLYLSDPTWDATYFLPVTSYQGHLISDPVANNATYLGGSWLATDDFFIRVDNADTSPKFGFESLRVQVGYINPNACTVHEGVDMFVHTAVDGELSRSQAGLVSVSQGQVPTRPAAGAVVPLDGCWELTTDFPNTSTIVGARTDRYQFFPDGTAQGPTDAPVYAAVENANNETMFVMLYDSGTVVGGELTLGGSGELEVHPDDGILFSPELAQTVIDPLPSDYMSGAPDPRQGTFSMAYVGPTC